MLLKIQQLSGGTLRSYAHKRSLVCVRTPQPRPLVMMHVPSGGTCHGANALDVIETVFQRCRIVPRFAVSRIPDGAQRPCGVDEPFGGERGIG